MERNSNLKIIEQCFLSRDQDYLFNSFPAIIPDERARGTMGVCIGFITGLAIAGEVAQSNDYADSLIKSLTHLNRHEMFGSNKADICKLAQDGTALSFSFVKLRLLASFPEEQVVRDPHSREVANVNGKDYNIFMVGQDPYIFNYNGGLIFHGLNNQTFSVTLLSVNGWQIHT